MTIFPASSSPKPLHLAVYCYNGVQQEMGDGSYQQLCEYSITVTVAALAALSTTLGNRQSPQTATRFAVGQYKFLRFDVQGSSLTEVHLEVRACGAVPASAVWSPGRPPPLPPTRVCFYYVNSGRKREGLPAVHSLTHHARPSHSTCSVRSLLSQRPLNRSVLYARRSAQAWRGPWAPRARPSQW